MQKEWSSFRITLLLYLIVLILPFSFYFVYTSFQTMQQDTKIVRQSSWISGAMEHLGVEPNNPKLIVSIDKTLEEISLWVTQNNDSELYIGGQTLAKDFAEMASCWSRYKESLMKQGDTQIRQQSLQCYELSDTMAIIIEKMVYLKQNKIINLFYFSLALAMILLLLVIYLVRAYIRAQLKKHAIHDHETKLFNKKYFIAELKTSCARSTRYHYPLSMLSITIDGFDEGHDHYDKKTKAHILKMIGGLITSLTRTSDTAARYDDNHFLILLPDTEEENALILEGRVQEALNKHDFMADPKPNFKFSTTHFKDEETPETCIARAERLLHD